MKVIVGSILGALKKMDEVTAHKRAVRHAVKSAVQAGITVLGDVLQLCEGADPILVSSLLSDELQKSRKTRKASTESIPDYELLSTLPFQLPAPDPSRSQWWFSSAALAHLLSIVETRTAQFAAGKILCLGTPSLGPHLAHRHVTVLDVDGQVLDAIRSFVGRDRVHIYDAAEKLPQSLVGTFQIAVLDPPWYPAAIYTFINRALSALAKGGEIICAFPGRLTRPGIETFRANLMRDLVDAGHEILAVERGAITYQVPRFERAALEHLGKFRSAPWRAADLLHIRKGSSHVLTTSNLARKPWYAFARRASEFRIFSSGTGQPSQPGRPEYPIAISSVQTSEVHTGRLVDATVMNKAQVPDEVLRRAVVEDPDMLSASAEILATSFDNLLRLPLPVPFETLRELQLTGASNLQTATALSSQGFCSILKLGWSRV